MSNVNSQRSSHVSASSRTQRRKVASPDCSSEYHEAMLHAFNEAADGVEAWEYGGAESKSEQELYLKAARDVARRIRMMANRYNRRLATKGAR